MKILQEKPAYLFALGFSAATALVLIGMAFDVGIVGEVGDRADLLYGTVIAVGAVGAILARLRAPAMARVLFATAATHVVVAVIALLTGRPQAAGTPAEVFLGGNVFFFVLWMAAGLLFRHAGRTTAGTGT